MNVAKVPLDAARIGAIAAALLFNAIPVIGVLLWGWQAFALVFLYWLENLVIGARTAASMLITPLFNRAAGVPWPAALGIAGFFTLHYGMFCFVHGVFVLTLFADAESRLAAFAPWAAMAGLLAREPNLALGFVSIILWQAALLVLFIVRGEVRSATPIGLMGAPYPRILVLHFTILAGGIVLLALDQPLGGLLLLTLIKTGFDVAEALGRSPRFTLAGQR